MAESLSVATLVAVIVLGVWANVATWLAFRFQTQRDTARRTLAEVIQPRR